MSDADHVGTQDAARAAVSAARRSVREGRVRTVSLDELDSYFDELKEQAAETLSPGRHAGL
jgi:hypothetical protein